MAMMCEKQKIGSLPVCLYRSGDSKKVILFLHGRYGNKEEAERIAGLVEPEGFDILAADLPGHGENPADLSHFNPWEVAPLLRKLAEYAQEQWEEISLYAVSIGAYFAMCALSDVPFRKAFFVSPILDLERLICNRMAQMGIDEETLCEQGEIADRQNDALSWVYLCRVRQMPVRWNTPTYLLYADRDGMTDRDAVDAFIRTHNAALTVAKNAEHWFHTPEQLAVLDAWVKKNTMKLEFRKAVEEELERIWMLYRSASLAPGSTWNENYPRREDMLEDFRTGNLYVIVREKTVIGAVSLLCEKEFEDLADWQGSDGTEQEFSRVVIAPEYRGYGLAKRMLVELFALLEKQGCHAVHNLAAKQNHAAVGTYRDLGFRFLGEHFLHDNLYYVCKKILSRTNAQV